MSRLKTLKDKHEAVREKYPKVIHKVIREKELGVLDVNPADYTNLPGISQRCSPRSAHNLSALKTPLNTCVYHQSNLPRNSKTVMSSLQNESKPLCDQSGSDTKESRSGSGIPSLKGVRKHSRILQNEDHRDTPKRTWS